MSKLQMAALKRLSHMNDLFSTLLDKMFVLLKDILILLINTNVTVFKR